MYTTPELNTYVPYRTRTLDGCLNMFSYELDKEKVTDGRSGPKHCMVSLRNPGCLDGLVLTTSMPTAQGQMHLVETRQLLDKGHVHAQARQRRVRRGGLKEVVQSKHQTEQIRIGRDNNY